MSASGFSSWRTPNAGDTEVGPPHSQKQVMLANQARTWPTPSAALTNDGESAESWQARADALKSKGVNGNGAGMPLTIAAKMWPTPHTSLATGPGHRNPDTGANLQTVVAAFWSARDWKGSPDELRTGNARPLNEVTKTWPTPKSNDPEKRGDFDPLDHRTGLAGAARNLHFLNNPQVPASAISGPPSSRAIRSSLLRYLATTEPGLRAELRGLIRMSISARKAGWCRAYQRPCERRQLNALFAEWLMGWPRGWTLVPTASGSRAMGFTLWLQRQRIALSTLSWSYAPAPDAEPEMQQMELL